MANSKLVVRSHQPHRLGIAWAVAGLVLLLGAYVLYEWGKYRGGFDSRAASRDKGSLLEQVSELKRSNGRLREEIAMLTTSQEVDNEAYERVESTLTELQGEIQRQREELAFYRGIVSPADGSSGLKIHDLRVTANGGEGYRVRLVLVMAAARHDRRVSGNVNVTLEGAQDGRPTSYSLIELSADNDALAFSFLYFQDFERELILPAGFEPDRVQVEVLPRGRSAKAVRETYPWSVHNS